MLKVLFTLILQPGHSLLGSRIEWWDIFLMKKYLHLQKLLNKFPITILLLSCDTIIMVYEIIELKFTENTITRLLKILHQDHKTAGYSCTVYLVFCWFSDMGLALQEYCRIRIRQIKFAPEYTSWRIRWSDRNNLQ